jgi:hypothetical protein
MASGKAAKLNFAFLAVLTATLFFAPNAHSAAKSCRALVNSIFETTARAAKPPAASNQSRIKENPVQTHAEVTRELQAQDKALWRIDLQHFYESAVQFLQKRVTVSSVRSTLAKQRGRKLNLMHFLSQGKHNEAIDIYRRLFDNVELSYWTIKNTERQLQDPQLQIETKLKLEKRLFLKKRLFAQNYGEYISVRQYLEGIDANTAASPLFTETAARVLRSLGVHKFSEIHEDFAALKIPEERVPLQDVKNLFRSESQYTRLKLLADFRNEILSALRYLVSSEILVSGIDNILSRFPPRAADKLKNLVGLMRSAQLRHRTLPQIVEIESLPHDMEMRLQELRKKNSLSNNDELLVTYARTVEFTDSFNEIKAHAAVRAAEPQNNIMKTFNERLLAAEERAKHLPDISLYEKMSNIDVAYTLIQAGIVIKVTAPQVFNSAGDFFNFLVNAGFGLF